MTGHFSHRGHAVRQLEPEMGREFEVENDIVFECAFRHEAVPGNIAPTERQMQIAQTVSHPLRSRMRPDIRMIAK